MKTDRVAPPMADPLIVRIGDDGCPGPSVLRSVAHAAPGILHLAVSIQVVDRRTGRWLLQRRAGSKAVFPGRWANTCCTHPAPGEEPAAAAVRRLHEETGLVVDDLVPGEPFTYHAVDSRSGFVEHEHDHVFAVLADTWLASPDPDEIDELIRLPFPSALTLAESGAGAPWAGEVLRRSYLALHGGGR